MDENVPRYCDMHKLEGMKELVQWTPSFRPHPVGVARHVPAERGIPNSMRTPCKQTPVDEKPAVGNADVSVSGGMVETGTMGINQTKRKGKGKSQSKNVSSRVDTQLPFTTVATFRRGHFT